MLRLTAERRNTLGRESGATASHKTPPAVTADKAVSHCSPNGVIINVAGLHTARRRWNRKPRVTLSDAAVWTFYFLLTAVGLLALCVLLTILWPTP